MANENAPGKIRGVASVPVPRMVGETDIALVRRYGERLGADARIVEFGPWLGGVTKVLADYGRVHVVDRFIWTEANDAAHPGIAAPGGSFRPAFERLMAQAGVAPVIHQADFRDFAWAGEPVDLCFIDAPRSGAQLLACLGAIAGSLVPGAPLLVKRGVDPTLPDMMGTIEQLAGLGVVEVVHSAHPRWCNIAVLRPGPRIGDFAAGALTPAPLDTAPLSPAVRDPWGGALYALVRISERIVAADWAGAYRLLDQLAPEPANLDAWDGLAARLELPDGSDEDLWVFATIFAQHNDAAPTGTGPVGPDGSLAGALRAYWANNAGQARRAAVPPAKLIAAAYERGAMAWPGRLLDRVRGRRVIEIGPGLGLSAAGFACAGASAYLGLETEALTPEMLEAETRLAEATFLPFDSIETLEPDAFDLCLLHEAAAGREELLERLARAASRLLPKGQVLRLSGKSARRLRLPRL